MLLTSNNEDRTTRLREKLRTAAAVTPELMSAVVAEACTRLPLLNRDGQPAVRIRQLIQAAAWLDVGVALVALELPGWTLRRLAYDDGEWHCSLSAQLNVPIEIDDTVDASHPVLPLAVLSALVDARRADAVREPAAATPKAHPATGHIACCDNFA